MRPSKYLIAALAVVVATLTSWHYRRHVGLPPVLALYRALYYEIKKKEKL